MENIKKDIEDKMRTVNTIKQKWTKKDCRENESYHDRYRRSNWNP